MYSQFMMHGQKNIK